MKKIIFYIIFLNFIKLYAQKPTVDYIKFNKYTTTEKNAIDVSDLTKSYIVYDSTLGKWQTYIGVSWVNLADDYVLPSNIAYTHVPNNYSSYQQISLSGTGDIANGLVLEARGNSGYGRGIGIEFRTPASGGTSNITGRIATTYFGTLEFQNTDVLGNPLTTKLKIEPVTGSAEFVGSVTTTGLNITGKDDTYVVLAGGGTALLSNIGSGSGFSGSYNDLTDKPTSTIDWSLSQTENIHADNYTRFSGDYNDLINKPSASGDFIYKINPTPVTPQVVDSDLTFEQNGLYNISNLEAQFLKILGGSSNENWDLSKQGLDLLINFEGNSPSTQGYEFNKTGTPTDNRDIITKEYLDSRLGGISSSSNVQSDFNSISGDDFIKNKPFGKQTSTISGFGFWFGNANLTNSSYLVLAQSNNNRTKFINAIITLIEENSTVSWDVNILTDTTGGDFTLSAGANTAFSIYNNEGGSQTYTVSWVKTF